jgi:hypothetical protein
MLEADLTYAKTEAKMREKLMEKVRILNKFLKNILYNKKKFIILKNCRSMPRKWPTK